MADEYAKAVMEAARLHRRLVARLVDEMRVVEPLAGGERFKAELMTVQNQYETILMTEMIAMQALHMDVSAAGVTIWQAQGVLMELLDVDAGGALLWLETTAARRGETLDTVAAGVVERRTI